MSIQKLYKVTDDRGYTRGRTAWGTMKTNAVRSRDFQHPRLCTGDVIHAYTSPWLASLFEGIHFTYFFPRFFVARGEVVVNDGTKCGVFELTTLYEIKFPVVHHLQRLERKTLFMISKELDMNFSYVEHSCKAMHHKNPSRVLEILDIVFGKFKEERV